MAHATQLHRQALRVSPLMARLRHMLFGTPLPSSLALEHRLPISLALPVFASDAISSVAYSTQEILMVLAGVALLGNAGMQHLQLGISLAIGILLVIVATSYRRAVVLYPTSGGSYTVTKSNLGAYAGLVAAAALLVDYIMTVAVSISSGVDALISAYRYLLPWRVEIAIVLVAIITLANLRGTKESGIVFALPLYSFVIMVGAMIVTTLIRFAITGGHLTPMGADPALPAHLRLPHDLVLPKAGLTLGIFVLLRAFANGCSALTGVEAVSNGVSAFKPPESKNAAKTLAIMLSILLFLVLGLGFAAYAYHARPSESETILSMVTRASFGLTIPYYFTQFATLLILLVAANTSFADFPRLMAFVARDGFAPKAFTRVGDRLVFHRGIIALALISVFVIIVFRANVTSLIGLYAIGVFICFTLSQLGMAKKIREMREKGWRGGMIVNIIGACVTGLVAIVVAVSKFTEGAWMVLVIIPIIIGVCILIKRHYDWFDTTMTVHPFDYNPLSEPAEPLTVLVLVSSDVHRGTLEGLECGRAIAETHPDSVMRAVHIEMDEEKTPRLLAKWEQFVKPYMGDAVQLDVVPSPYRWLIEPLMDYLDWTDLERSTDRIIVVLPEFETGSWLTQFLHNFTAHRLRSALLNRPHVTVVSSRYFMKPMAWRLGRGGLVY